MGDTYVEKIDFFEELLLVVLELADHGGAKERATCSLVPLLPPP